MLRDRGLELALMAGRGNSGFLLDRCSNLAKAAPLLAGCKRWCSGWHTASKEGAADGYSGILRNLATWADQLGVPLPLAITSG